MAQEQTKGNAPSNEVLQQGYRNALFALRNAIEKYKSANEASLPSVITEIRQDLLDVDKGTVQKLFGGAGAIRTTTDESFSLSGADVPDEIRNVSIPKKIFTQDISAKKFFPDYDRINYQKQQAVAEVEGAAKAEGAATKLDAAKQAVFGQGFGGVGQVLAGAVGIRPGARPAAAGATPAAAEAARPTAAPAQQHPSAETTPSAPAGRRRTLRPAKTTTETAAEGAAISEKEKQEDKEEAEAALETVQRMRKLPDAALLQKRFVDILTSLERDPDPFAHDGAAFYEVRRLKKDVDQAQKKQAQPELKELYDRLDELGSEYRTSQIEQRQGKDGKARLQAALRDVRSMAGLPPALVMTPIAVAGAVAGTTAAAVVGAGAAPGLASLLLRADDLVKDADDIRLSIEARPDEKWQLEDRDNIKPKLHALSEDILAYATENEPDNKNLIALGGAVAQVAEWKDQRAARNGLFAYGKQRGTLGPPDSERRAEAYSKADDLVYRMDDYRQKVAQGQTDEKERDRLERALRRTYYNVNQQIRLFDPQDPKLAQLKDALVEISVPFRNMDANGLEASLSQYGQQRIAMGPTVDAGYLTAQATNLVQQVSSYNAKLTGQETPQDISRRQELGREAQELSNEIDKFNRLYDPKNQALTQTRGVLIDLNKSLSKPELNRLDQGAITKGVAAYGSVPKISVPAAMAALGGVALGGLPAPAVATAAVVAPAAIAVTPPEAGPTSIEVQAGQNVNWTLPVIPPPPSAASRVIVPPPPIAVQAQAEITERAVLPAPPPPALAPEAGAAPERGTVGPQAQAPLALGVRGAARETRQGPARGATTRGAQAVTVVQAPGQAAPQALEIAPGAEAPQEAEAELPSEAEEALGVMPAAAPRPLPAVPSESAGERPSAARPARGAARPGMAAPAGVTAPSQPTAAGAPAARPAGAARVGVPGARPIRMAAAPSKGYQAIGPQKIKPPMGRALELQRAMGLGAAQTAAGLAAGEGYEEGLGPEEGLELSGSGLEQALSEGAEAGPALPVQFGEFYNPLEARHRMALPESPGFMGVEPTAAAETAEGGVVESELAKAQALAAQQQAAMLSAEQLVGGELIPSLQKPTARGARAEKATAGPSGPVRRAPPAGREEEAGPLARLMRLQAREQAARTRLAQARQRIEELKAQYEQVKKAVQSFRDLKNVGELLSGISGWTLLALWVEWNLDIINTKLAMGRIPYLEKPLSPDASIWEKGKHQVKDGVTLLADVLIPLNLLVSLFMPLIVAVVIFATIFGSVAGVVSLILKTYNW